MSVIEIRPQSRQKYGVVGVGFRQEKVASIKQAVSDGDTVSSRPHDNLAIRFLGVDAPETKYPLGTNLAFLRLDDQKWVNFLANDAMNQQFKPPMTPALRAHLLGKVTGNAATNHRRHAERAEEEFVSEVEKDVELLRQGLNITSLEAREQFRFFMAFAHEVMDGFGRLLCYINREQEDTPRPDFYQERLLATGRVLPFFVWPNVDPYIKRTTTLLRAAVPTPADIAGIDAKAPLLAKARTLARNARAKGVGVFEPASQANPTGPLILEPFEIRFLARGNLTQRWVIDLGAGNAGHPNHGKLLDPQSYFSILPEDRLFVPDEYRELFTSQQFGWTV